MSRHARGGRGFSQDSGASDVQTRFFARIYARFSSERRLETSLRHPDTDFRAILVQASSRHVAATSRHGFSHGFSRGSVDVWPFTRRGLPFNPFLAEYQNVP
jgi:hypothetical protein